MPDVAIQPASQLGGIGLQIRVRQMRCDLVAFGQRLAQCLADTACQSCQKIVIAADIHHRALHAVIAKQRAALQILRNEHVALAEQCSEFC